MSEEAWFKLSVVGVALLCALSLVIFFVALNEAIEQHNASVSAPCLTR